MEVQASEDAPQGSSSQYRQAVPQSIKVHIGAEVGKAGLLQQRHVLVAPDGPQRVGGGAVLPVVHQQSGAVILVHPQRQLARQPHAFRAHLYAAQALACSFLPSLLSAASAGTLHSLLTSPSIHLDGSLLHAESRSICLLDHSII